MTIEISRLIAAAYRWQRRLGNQSFQTDHCHIVANPAWPGLWDANHADAVTAQTDEDIDAVFATMDTYLDHTPWRVLHTDGDTPDAFSARLALDGYLERPATIQMALVGEVLDRGATVALWPVAGDADWASLRRLVAEDHAEGRRTVDLAASANFTADVIASYRSKRAAYHFYLVIEGGEAVAYGAWAIAPNGVGMIDDLFTLQSARRRGVATGMIAAVCDRMRDRGCRTIFLGALASERPKHLYHRLGFHPVGLARTWIKDRSAAA